MSQQPHSNDSNPPDMRAVLRKAVDHFEHVLPGQAPIQDFVHHNTLHGFQHLPFPEALAAARRVTGAYGYLPAEEFHTLYQNGRITRADLESVLQEEESIEDAAVVIEANGLRITRAELLITTLTSPIHSITGCQLVWQIEEQAATTRFNDRVSEAARQQLLTRSDKSEAEAISELWQASLSQLDLEHFLIHAEEMTDLSPEQAEQMFRMQDLEEHEVGGDESLVHIMMRRAGATLLDGMLDRVGTDLTLRGFLQLLTGQDILEEIRPLLVRQLASYLDQGVAAWHDDNRSQGFYRLWRQNAVHDFTWLLEELPVWRDELEMLPDDAIDTVITELHHLGLPQEYWSSYIERLALELPGWSGMFLWRHLHPGYNDLEPGRVEMMDYLAVRLVLERIFAQRLCREQWDIEPSLDMLRWYFRRRRSELFVRNALYNEHLPEYLVNLAQHLLRHRDTRSSSDEYSRWQQLADMIWTWKHGPASDRSTGHTVSRDGWRLFLLAQHLGLAANDIRSLSDIEIEECFATLDMDDETSGFLWLRAYERHYREQVFNALGVNHGRGPWRERNTRPDAQLVFCMDDREEGIRRHLEELNPRLETLGAAGFFGVAINWKGLDDQKVSPLCPVVVTPAHEIREQAQCGHERLQQQHQRRRSLRLQFKDLLFQETRRNLLGATALILCAAPAALLTLTGKALLPQYTGRLSDKLRNWFDKDTPTRITLTSQEQHEATPAQPRIGFTDTEQADRVQGFLRTIGLQDGFSPLVVMMGHGSGSQNNPHMAAYDCGACSGRHGGPNARVFAAMANRPEIRALLAQRGVQIPQDTWFLGAEHNTCDEMIHWYDLEQVPQNLQANLQQLRAELDEAIRASAHERARRFASAPDTGRITPQQAYKHIVERAYDFSQPRPELGHATNATAFIGRRSMSRGAFFDRRAFLISYDPSQDPEGKVVEAILLAVGPVGAGINLEYYFSTVNNEGYGCGSKVTHNITGLLGVMHGASDDLRTGLPRQMIEIHEAMRLLVVVEASTEILTQIYLRQPPLQELVGNGWLLLATKDPDSETIHFFDPAKGWQQWDSELQPLPMVEHSRAWYSGHREPLPMALISRSAIPLTPAQERDHA